MTQLVLFSEPKSKGRPGEEIIPGTAVVSLWQPWASAVAVGAKSIETRSWAAPRSCWGKLLVIHAAARRLTRDERAIYGPSIARLGYPNAEALPSGAAVAICRLVECVPTDTLRESISPTEESWGDFTRGRWGWKLELIERFEPPIPASGHQGVWRWR